MVEYGKYNLLILIIINTSMIIEDLIKGFGIGWCNGDHDSAAPTLRGPDFRGERLADIM